MNAKPLGYLQRQMVSFMRHNIELYGPAISNAFHIQSDSVSKRVAASLEKRDIIQVDRAYEMWLVRPNLDHPVFN
jgi:hypothetical protein